MSLVVLHPTDPWLPPGHPFTDVLMDDSYWTATSRSDAPGDALTFSFLAGVPGNEIKTNTNYSWCVRGAQGIDGM